MVRPGRRVDGPTHARLHAARGTDVQRTPAGGGRASPARGGQGSGAPVRIIAAAGDGHGSRPIRRHARRGVCGRRLLQHGIARRQQTVLAALHGTFLAPEIADRYTDVSVSAPLPIADAARFGTAVLLPDLDAYREEFPEIVADTIAAGIQASASLPLYREDGTLVGVIGFAWTTPTKFDDKLQSALHAVGELCSATIERAERYDADHQFIVELSASLLGALPVMAGLEASARYLPASDTVSVGGDWYEGLSLDDRRLALVVGDVTGHGLTAAADMALLRGMITALLHSGVAVADVFSEMSGVLLQRSGLLLATAALAVVDVAGGTITYATAGHPPPLVQLPTGEIRRLDVANAPMIGLRQRDGSPRPCRFRWALGPSCSPTASSSVAIGRSRSGSRRSPRHFTTLASGLTPSDVSDVLLDALLDSGQPRTTSPSSSSATSADVPAGRCRGIYAHRVTVGSVRRGVDSLDRDRAGDPQLELAPPHPVDPQPALVLGEPLAQHERGGPRGCRCRRGARVSGRAAVPCC